MFINATSLFWKNALLNEYLKRSVKIGLFSDCETYSASPQPLPSESRMLWFLASEAIQKTKLSQGKRLLDNSGKTVNCHGFQSL